MTTNDTSAWSLIESDPGIFTEFLKTLGVARVEVQEIYDFDGLTNVQQFPCVFGLIFLFKWTPSDVDLPVPSADTITTITKPSHVYFANQLIDNACATQAILSIILNRPELDLGPELTAYKEFTRDLPPVLKGLAVGNAEFLRRAHNCYARVTNESFATDVMASPVETDALVMDEDVYHFISYVPIQGRLYELDGLQLQPKDLGQVSDDQFDWLKLAVPHLKQRIEKHVKEEIRFNLMALIPDSRLLWLERLQFLDGLMMLLVQHLNQPDNGAESHPLDTASWWVQCQTNPLAVSQYVASLNLMDSQRHYTQLELFRQDFENSLRSAQERLDQYRLDNLRRKHNYVPFLTEMIKLLNAQGVVPDLLAGVPVEQILAAREQQRK